ncbi:hypothetical protein DN30_468 [Vibrio cholerae]|nr:hypothetical protein DN30_468 [Vibrio cholerae]
MNKEILLKDLLMPNGARHLNFPNYICSPDMRTLSNIFKKIHDLELIHCPSKSIQK